MREKTGGREEERREYAENEVGKLGKGKRKVSD